MMNRMMHSLILAVCITSAIALKTCYLPDINKGSSSRYYIEESLTCCSKEQLSSSNYKICRDGTCTKSSHMCPDTNWEIQNGSSSRKLVWLGKCEANKKIHYYQRCDGVRQCANGADEFGCPRLMRNVRKLQSFSRKAAGRRTKRDTSNYEKKKTSSRKVYFIFIPIGSISMLISYCCCKRKYRVVHGSEVVVSFIPVNARPVQLGTQSEPPPYVASSSGTSIPEPPPDYETVTTSDGYKGLRTGEKPISDSYSSMNSKWKPGK